MPLILVATSGYSYRDWKGKFYPEDIKESDMLSFYSREFPFTEVNSTYYSLPSPYMIYHMMKKTPENFLFVIKAYGGMTHQQDLGENTVGKFKEALKPLIEAGRLGCVLAQFPYSFHNTEKNRDFLKRLRERLEGIPLAVEFRCDDWLRLEVIKLLRENQMAFVCVDEPPVKGLLPPAVIATSSIGYVRFHGRNAEKWYNHQKSYERYDYLYTEKELAEWVPRIKELSRKTEVVFIAMNNHFNASAVINARQLLGLLKEVGL